MTEASLEVQRKEYSNSNDERNKVEKMTGESSFLWYSLIIPYLYMPTCLSFMKIITNILKNYFCAEIAETTNTSQIFY